MGTESQASNSNVSPNGAPRKSFMSNFVASPASPSAAADSSTNLLNNTNPDASLSLDGPLDDQATLFSTLKDLFIAISTHPDKTGVVGPQAFIQQLKKENELFRSTMHQDAHEFLNYLLNTVAEHLEKQDKEAAAQPSQSAAKPEELVAAAKLRKKYLTWIHRLFEGVLTNETKCLTCETVTSRDEAFIDLSIDIEDNTSLTSCLRQFSASEMLRPFFLSFCSLLWLLKLSVQDRRTSFHATRVVDYKKQRSE